MRRLILSVNSLYRGEKGADADASCAPNNNAAPVRDGDCEATSIGCGTGP